MKHSATLLIFLLISGITYSQPELTSEQWQEDLDFLEQQLPEIHVNLFYHLDKEDFYASIDNLRKRIPDISSSEIIIEIARITSSAQDGHTRTWLIPNEQNGFHFYPFMSYWFDDGFYIQAIAKDHADAVGGRITHVNSIPIDSVFKIITPLIARDNWWQAKANFPIYLAVPEILKATGIIEDISKPKFTVVKEGETYLLNPVTVEPNLPIYKDHFWSVEHRKNLFKDTDLVYVREKENTPLLLEQREDWVWMDYLPEYDAIYVHYDAIANNRNESSSKFYERLFEDIERYDTEKLILDLRVNGGGNNMLNKPLVLDLIKHEKINQFGKLVVLNSRFTFSAASHLVSKLELYTNVIFAGEPTGGSPVHFGDTDRFTLPNSELQVYASSLFWQNTTPFDRRKTTPPYLYVPYTFQDYISNNDPVLETVLGFKEKRSVVEQIEYLIRREEFQEAADFLKNFHENSAHKYVSTSSSLNGLGYQLKNEQAMKAAQAVFEMNVLYNPDYINGYDSLTEFYRDTEQDDKAVKYYEKVLELAPGTVYAERAKRHLNTD